MTMIDEDRHYGSLEIELVLDVIRELPNDSYVLFILFKAGSNAAISHFEKSTENVDAFYGT